MLANNDLPDFGAVVPDTIVATATALVAQHRAAIAAISAAPTRDFASVMLASEAADIALSHGWSPVSHLHGVADTPEFRTAYASAQELLSAYYMEAGQNVALYQAIVDVAAGPVAAALPLAERRALDLALRNFKLSGVALEGDARTKFAANGVELSTLATQFSSAVMDATEAWSEHITDVGALDGLPESSLAILATYAAEKQLPGWLVTLRQPSVLAVLMHAKDRDLRARVYRAFHTRASELSDDGAYDNAGRIERIMALRHEQAQILGFANSAARSLETKMAETPAEALHFLTDLAARAKPVASVELDEAKAYALAQFGIADFAPWDVSFVAEAMRRERHGLDQEAIKAYFPAPTVVAGTWALIERLYGVRPVKRDDVSLWHPDAEFYDLVDGDNRVIAGVYLDMHARAGKRGGAWMDVARTRFPGAGGGAKHLPVAYIVCNFAPIPADGPALLTHNDVLTTLHEFGHALHHMLTEIDVPSVGGIRGVEWDAVELPSQIMENFAWNREALNLLSGHYQTGAPLPDDLFGKMLAAKRFQAGLALLRQIEFGLFDLRLHDGYDPAKGAQPLAVIAGVRRDIGVLHIPDWQRMPHSFGHIFSGGYAAGYYSYLWAELLSADAFGKFEEVGIFSADAGAAFRREVLAQGASRPAAENFAAFRGREPDPAALLKAYGLAG